MTVNNGRRLKGEINVTPMIDVLLVLLVIFMIVTPVTSVGLDAAVPQDAQGTQSEPQNPLVVTVSAGRQIYLNQQRIGFSELAGKLQELARLRPRGVVFVRGARDLEFQDVAEVLDIVRGSGFLASLMTK